MNRQKVFDFIFFVFFVSSYILLRANTLIIWRIVYFLFIVAMIFVIIKNKQFYLTFDFFIKIIFLLILLISTIFVIDVDNSISATLRYLRIIVFSFLISNYILHYNKWLLFIKSIMISGILLSLYILIIYDFSLYDIYRVTADGLNANVIGMNIGFSLWAVLYLSVKENKVSYMLFLPLLIIVMFFTGSRKALIMLIIALSGYLWYIFKNRGFKLILFSAIIIIFGLIFRDIIAQISIFSRFQNFLNFLEQNTSNEVSLSLRSQMIRYGIDFFYEKPLIGYGIDNFRLLISPIFYETYSHNNYIELLVGTGFIGFIAYYIPFIIVLIYALKRYVYSTNLKEKTDIFFIIILMISIIALDVAAVTYDNKVNQFMMTFSIIYIYNKKFKIELRNK